MNNLLLGASEPVAFGYDETVGGGEGGTPDRLGVRNGTLGTVLGADGHDLVI